MVTHCYRKYSKCSKPVQEWCCQIWRKWTWHWFHLEKLLLIAIWFLMSDRSVTCHHSTSSAQKLHTRFSQNLLQFLLALGAWRPLLETSHVFTPYKAQFSKTKEIWNRWLCLSLNIRWHLKLFLMFYKIWIASLDCISMYWNLWFNSQMSTLFTNLTTEMELFVQMAAH